MNKRDALRELADARVKISGLEHLVSILRLEDHADSYVQVINYLGENMGIAQDSTVSFGDFHVSMNRTGSGIVVRHSGILPVPMVVIPKVSNEVEVCLR